MSHPVITGADGPPTPQNLWQNRLEIRELIKDRRQFSLYIQALKRMMKLDFANALSFPDIGGIHGMPYTQWGESGGSVQSPDTSFGGYCTHGSVLFPTWHRPLRLLQQELCKHAKNIAWNYTGDDASDWMKAAKDLRSPYWDWASYDTDKKLPAELVSPTIRILTKHGKNSSRTLCMASTPPAASKSAPKSIIVCNHTANPGFGDLAASLESIHDDMHDLIGGTWPVTGHMADLTVAGFDPIFYLHHTNVDRFLTLWSALNPTEWVNPGKQKYGTWTISDGSMVDTTTALSPFWDSNSTYWDSTGVRVTDSLRYTYPEFNNLNTSDPEEIKWLIRKKVEALYGPDESKSAVSPRKTPDVNAVYEWTIRIKFKKHELSSSFSVLVYLRETYVGRVSAFVARETSRCANCVRNANVEIEGYVHLTQSVRSMYASHQSLDHDAIVGHLKDDLSLRIKGAKKDGTPAQLSDLTSLKAMPFHYTVSQEPLDRRPTYGAIVHHPTILEGKAGHVPDPSRF
ncbi:Di-copper centre-containing protein [Obba rivulosa]|uniref:tyrosinase n=1 Tax=Obba rivulosa TaxID=1052685 RepID=A0A8E2AVU6_9APHY|nr:Di-copper centre-containing protein [Obba rivulosa]